MNVNNIKCFSFYCNKNFEKITIMTETFKNRHSRYIDEIEFSNSDLGICFSSLLNSKNKLIQFQNEINIKNIIKSENTIDNINIVFNELINVNKYFALSYSSFLKCIEEIDLIISTLVNDNGGKEITKKDIYNIYVDKVNKALKHIISTITYVENFINSNPSNIPVPMAMVDLKNIKNFSYNYTIQEISDLITTSYYQILLNNMHIKKCKYPHCDKYFVTAMGQTRYCENPCPANPSETCRSIRKTIDRTTDVPSDLEIELDSLEKKLNRIRTRFYDNIKNKNIPQRKKKLISNNQQKLKDITHELKRYIKGNTSDKRNHYLKVYQNFLNEIETNLNLSPPIFKIKKPKY